MRKMKDCGIDWIGQVPNDWEITRLRFTAEIVRGGSPRPIESFISDDGEGFNWVKIGDADKDNKYITHTSCKIIRNGLSKTRMVHANDLILTNSMSFGEPYIMGIDGCIHDGWVAFSKYKGIVKEFLYWCLLSDLCRIQFEKQVDGGVVQNLNIDKIGNTIVFLPPLAEQQKIADFLDEKCGEIDSIRSDVQREIEILNDYKKSVITEAVTKGLNPKAKLKDSGIEWIGKIPEGWTIVPINYLTTSRSGGTPDRNKSQYWEEGTIPWMASGEVNKFLVYDTKEKITELATRLSNAKIVPANSVMVALNGQGKTKGMSAVLKIDAACNQSLCAFQCDPMRLNYMYLLYCFQSMYKFLRFQAGDDVRDGLAASFVKKQRIPLPSLNEQNEIASFIDEKCSEIDATIADKQKQLETLDEYKKSLIFEYVTGKKEVP